MEGKQEEDGAIEDVRKEQENAKNEEKRNEVIHQKNETMLSWRLGWKDVGWVENLRELFLSLSLNLTHSLSLSLYFIYSLSRITTLPISTPLTPSLNLILSLSIAPFISLLH